MACVKFEINNISHDGDAHRTSDRGHLFERELSNLALDRTSFLLLFFVLNNTFFLRISPPSDKKCKI